MTDVLTIDPTTDPRWHRLASGGGGSLFTSPPWLRALRDTYDFEFRAEILADDAGAPVSGLAWTMVRDLRGQRVVALPFCDFADPVLADPSHWEPLTRPLFAPGVPVRARALRASGYLDDPRLRVVNQTRWHAVDLRRDPDEMWRGIDESARRAIRKAEKSGVKIRRADGLADVHRFHALHCGVRRHKYGMLTQPVALLENLWHQLAPDDGFALLLAEVDGEVVGGTLYLMWGDTIYYKLNASLASGLAVRPNDLLVWSGMLLGAERGLARFDFGQSDLDQEGLLRYKEKYATEQATIRSFAHEPAGWEDPPTAGGAVLSELTALLVSPGVPDDVYRRAGDLLYRNFC